MPAKSFKTQLDKVNKDNEKVVELLERELERERQQAEAASASVAEARSKLQDLEGRRPALASEVFAGDKEYADLDALDSEMDRLRRHAEVAEIAQEQAGERAPAIEQRMTKAAREAAGKRYDVLASERRERAVELDSTLDALTGQVDALLDLDRRQRDEEQNLGIAAGGVTYDEQLETHLKIRLQAYIREAAMSVNGIDMNIQRAKLVHKDYKTLTLDEVRTEHETEAESLGAAREQRDAHDEARSRKERYDNRKAELYAHYGAAIAGGEVPGGPGRRGRVDAMVAERLQREFPEEFSAEQRGAMERRRVELRGLLGHAGENLSDDERQQLEERVNEQLAEEFPSVETLRSAV